ncbi:TlpA family protein disulfide reductase [Flavobacterium sp.]|uniref:TlpA family protein disulfide reductase n=1 Tax=Flavobacterium sp. TaxID=239 RepID=UPI0040472FC8
MKYFIFFVILLLNNLLAGVVSDEYSVYIPLFMLLVFITVTLFQKFKISVNRYFVCFSYSAFLLLLSLFKIIQFDKAYIIIFLLPITAFLSYIFYNATTLFKKIGIVALIIIYSVFASTIVLQNVHYFNNYNKITSEVETEIKLYNSKKELLKLDKNKIYVLDFWTTSCGVCIEKFPLFNNLTNHFSNKKEIEFFAVNVAIERDEFYRTIDFIENKKFNFENLYIFDQGKRMSF